VVDLHGWPLWVLWLCAAAAGAIFLSGLLRVLPAPVRRGAGGRSVFLGIAVFLVWVGLSGTPRQVLWFGAVTFLVAAFPLYWLGPLPADLPRARDPAARRHPRYQEMARRGRTAGVVLVVLVLLAVVSSTVFIKL
jgi:hypothetical protein